MDQLVWSILTQGLLTPLVVRPLPTGKYEVISGHRRLHACKKAGIDELYDDIAIDNPSVALFFKCGFVEVLRTEDFILVKKELSD